MNGCAEVNGLLPLSAGGDLDARTQERVSVHLAGCAACRAEDALYRGMLSSISGSFSSNYSIPAAVRTRIATKAAERTSRPGWIAWLPARFPAGRLAMLSAATIILLVTAISLTLRSGDGHSIAPERSVMQIEVKRAEGGGIRLAWSNGRMGTYTVYKSHDPRLFSHSETHVVAGNIWTDEDSASGPIVYYRIE